MIWMYRKVGLLEAIVVGILSFCLVGGAVFGAVNAYDKDQEEREAKKMFFQSCISAKANEGMSLVEAEKECDVVWRWK